MGGRVSSVFFERLKDPVPGIQLLKGIECNLGDQAGEIDMPARHIPYYDIILLGIHPNTAPGKSPAFYTEKLLAAMEQNPFVDIITHPNSKEYPLDFEALAVKAAQLDITIEINNSKTDLQRIDDAITLELMSVCKASGCRIAVNSDAHAVNEIGQDRAVRPLLEKVSFPKNRIVNHTAESAFAFVKERRQVHQEKLWPTLLPPR